MDRNVHIELGQNGRNGRVVIDGHDVSHLVQSLTIEARANEVTRLSLHLVPVRVDVKAPAEVQMFQPVALPLTADERSEVRILRRQLQEARAENESHMADITAALIIESNREGEPQE